MRPSIDDLVRCAADAASQFGPYERLYRENACLWQRQVGAFVRRYVARSEHRSAGRRALDLGGGEGDNAIFLAAHGYEVEMVDLSPTAIGRFFARVSSLPDAWRRRLDAHCEPIGHRPGADVFDLVVAYGVLHCFPSRAAAAAAAAYCVSNVRRGGALIISTITNAIEPDESHPELRPCYLPSVNDLDDWFARLTMVDREVEVIEEAHGSGAVHRHEIARAIFVRTDQADGVQQR